MRSVDDLKLRILEIVTQKLPRPTNKFNLIGKAALQGELEQVLGERLSVSERYAAYRAFDELIDTGHLQPTYEDLVAPESWFVTTDYGAAALRTGNIDDLDAALAKIAPHLVEIRRGARRALASDHPHSLSQAAHSARELIDQTLKLASPEETVKAQNWYKPDPGALPV